MLPLAPRYEGLPIWPTDPKLAIVREAGKISRPSGFDLPGQTKLSTLMYNRYTTAKMFSNACTTGDARAALDGALKEIEDLKKQA